MGVLLYVVLLFLCVTKSKQVEKVTNNDENILMDNQVPLFDTSVPPSRKSFIHTNGTNSWCVEAEKCKSTNQEICGYDDIFGFAKFRDFCHLLQVNCYWEYNFTMIPSCDLSYSKTKLRE